jgi:purine nucleosidase
MPALNQQQVEEITNSEHAVDFIIRKIKESPNKVSILCLGPLTNVALAIKKEKNVLKNVKQIVMMGGNVTAPGNTPNHVSEWNFYADANAVQHFLENIEGNYW